MDNNYEESINSNYEESINNNSNESINYYNNISVAIANSPSNWPYYMYNNMAWDNMYYNMMMNTIMINMTPYEKIIQNLIGYCHCNKSILELKFNSKLINNISGYITKPLWYENKKNIYFTTMPFISLDEKKKKNKYSNIK